MESYRRQEAGIAHRLVIVFNGMRSAQELQPFRLLLRGLDHHSLEMPVPTQDIPAYFEAAARIECEFVCFVNSYAVILAADWLAMLHAHASREGVGLVGATASWESHYTTTAATDRRLPLPHLLRPRGMVGWTLREAGRLQRLARNRRGFAPFPNPHVRSNSFMIRRDLFLALRRSHIQNKTDALQFESGRAGMSTQVVKGGLSTLVIGRDGVGYTPDKWPLSDTFRVGRQSNLLVSDNRTREYLEAPPEMQARLREVAWGIEWR